MGWVAEDREDEFKCARYLQSYIDPAPHRWQCEKGLCFWVGNAVPNICVGFRFNHDLNSA